jgi:hypothetical protein
VDLSAAGSPEEAAAGEARRHRVRCPIETKEMLVAAAADRYFDDDHYRGFPAVLIRLGAIPEDELLTRLSEGWSMAAPRVLTQQEEIGSVKRE